MTKIYIKKGYDHRYDNSLTRKKSPPLLIRQLKTKASNHKVNLQRLKERTTKKLKAKKSKAKTSSSSSSSSSSLLPPPPSTQPRVLISTHKLILGFGQKNVILY